MCKLLTSSHCAFLISLCCHFASLSLALPLCLQAIFLPGQSPGNYSVVWEGETTSSLTQTCCYKFTLFWGRGVFSHLDPMASSVHLACKQADWHTWQQHTTDTIATSAHIFGWSGKKKRRKKRMQQRETEPAFLTFHMWLWSTMQPQWADS